jgi:integrase/recombinase XerD
MDVDVAMAGYKRHLKARGYAESTMVSYGANLRCFERYLTERRITDIRQVTVEVIGAYQQKVMSEPIAMESKALKIRPVKRLFEYLTDTHRVLVNPTEGLVETSRRGRKILPVLSVAEMRRLLDQPNLSLRTGIRDRAIMEVMYSTGIRLDELLHVEVYHVDLADGVIYIRKGKGRNQRVAPMGKKASAYLREYLEKIRPWHVRKNPGERTLFLNRSGTPLTPITIRSMMRKYRIRAGIEKNVSPHTFRRTCATHLLQQGADIRTIQKLLGHRRLSTTQGYTKVAPMEVKKTHTATHPGAGNSRNKNRCA